MWQKLIKITRDYFYISHREARGTLVLIILMLLIIFGTFFYRNMGDESSFFSSLTITNLDSLIQQDQLSSTPIILHDFDPNTETNLEALGVPSYLAKRIINYRQAGGQFKFKEDLTKIYGFPDSLYQTLEKYIKLPVRSAQKANQKKYVSSTTENLHPPDLKPRPLNLTFDLSTVDSVELQRLPGIGKVFASRIVKYRNRLGGYYTTDQLYEVYGIPKETVEILIKNTSTISEDVVQLDLNKATFKELLKHPYLEYEYVKNIFNFKQKFGGFNQVKDLQKNQLVPDSVFVKIAPYLKI